MSYGGMCPACGAVPCWGRLAGSPGTGAAGCAWDRCWWRGDTAARCMREPETTSPHTDQGTGERTQRSHLQNVHIDLDSCYYSYWTETVLVLFNKVVLKCFRWMFTLKQYDLKEVKRLFWAFPLMVHLVSVLLQENEFDQWWSYRYKSDVKHL